MHITNISEAKAQLSALIEKVLAGDEVIIGKAGKQALGKLKIPPDFRQVLDRQSFETLSVTVEHAHAVGDIPTVHRDPFDRMLLAQANVEGFTIVSRDSVFERYNIPLIKA